jgi:hypothetical protein
VKKKKKKKLKMLFVHWAQTSRLSIDDVCNSSIGRLKITPALLDAMPERVTVEPSNAVLRPEKPNCSSPSAKPAKAMRISESDSVIRTVPRATRASVAAENDDADTDATAPLVDQNSETSAASTVTRKSPRPSSPSSPLPPKTLQRQALTESWSAVREHLFAQWPRLTRQARPILVTLRDSPPHT